MTDSNAVGGLKWVRNEIVASLQRVRTWIEAVAETGAAAESGPDAIAALTEIRGVLASLQLPGALRLVEEMQDLCAAVAADSVASPAESAEALMLALIQLPDYLGRIQAGVPDAPLALLPAINDLRDSRGAPPLSEAELLVPTTVLADTPGATPAARWALVRVSKKIRPHFHRYLLQWFRGEGGQAGLVSLGRLFHQLHGYIQEGIYHELFLAGEKLVEGILTGGISADPSNKAIIGRLDRVIKPFAEDSQVWPDAEARALLADLLAQISRDDDASYRTLEPAVSERREPGAERTGAAETAPPPALGPEALADVSGEARKELSPIKGLLEEFAGGRRDSLEPLQQLAPRVARLATTLSVVGATDLVERLTACAEALEAMGRGELVADDTQLMKVAADLLGVELTLAELGGEARPEETSAATELETILAVTLNEARVELEKAKAAIADFADLPEDLRRIEDVPALFHGVAGALRVLSHGEVADVLDLLAQQVRDGYLVPRRVPTRAELDLLSEGLAAIELNLDSMSGGVPPPPELMHRAREAAEGLAAVRPLAEASTPAPAEQGASTAEPEAPSAPPEVPAAIDPELLEIFLEEAGEEQRTVREQQDRWREDPRDKAALTVLRRSFHTLKGSGRLVGALRMGEFAAAVETLLNRVIDGTVAAVPPLMSFMDEAVGLVPELVGAEAEARPFDIGPWIARAHALAEAPPAGRPEERVAQIIPWPLSVAAAAGPAAATPDAAQLDAVDPAQQPDEALAGARDELLEIFLVEARDHLGALRDYLAARADRAPFEAVDEDVMRSLHTLVGSARMSGVGLVAEATAPLERLFRLLAEGPVAEGIGAAALDLLARGVDVIERRLDHLGDDAADAGDLSQLGAEATALAERLAELPISGEAEAAAADAYEAARSEAIAEALGAETTEAVLLEVEAPAEALPGAEAPDAEATAEEISIEEVILDAVGAPQAPEAATSKAEAPEAEAPADEVQRARVPEEAAPEVEAPEAEALADEVQLAPVPEEAAREAEIPEPAAAPSEQPILAAEAGDAFQELPADRELLGIFLEDARELLDKLDEELRRLQLAPTEAAPLDALQRLLHTLKGSARLSGLTAIGDLSHAFESLLTAINSGKARVDDDSLEIAQRTLDTLGEQIEAVANGTAVRRAEHLVAALGRVLQEGPPAGDAAPAVAVMVPAVPAESASAVGRQATAVEDVRAERPAAAEAPSPLIRVRADLLNRLVNDAGEISIYRSRLAQQNGLLGFRLGELDQTVGRLREKLRHLEIETEAQILHRVQRDPAAVAPDHAEFDPLELDRFSTLQQLSRSLAETVNDLISLRTLLTDLQRDSDALLQQQARIADDLQDGLLRTRMVPFAQVVPRLHRLIRQTAQQTGREARLEVFGPEVELDRSIQERIVAPLEHLLRNAVAHGIEPPDERAGRGKPTSGVISLMLSREGNDVVITVADDGGGLNLEAIRRRALERGMISSATDLSDEEVAQLILTPGFSTAEKVTQIAGRGVGLDVVSSEIKQMSGAFALDTQPGRGTSFTIRLPLTLAIIEALLVSLGEEIFAIPHATIAGVSRLERDALESAYRGKGTELSYGGHDFRVMYLGSMLQLPAVPDLGERRWLPMLLVRAGDQRVAFHVDQLIGSERIVVKPLGPQLSSIRWLSGGTILADGRVALILDLIALIRSGAMHDYRPPLFGGGPQDQQQICVMVVDDSLTVRRVTTRLLRRHDMDVVTAQDGIEALTLLEERVPDVMLLDIEMPRMDGYELTRHVRRSPRFKELPIIMITSRTGEKHRNYALGLGVDRYLGKPYQEAELLDEIRAMAEGGR